MFSSEIKILALNATNGSKAKVQPHLHYDDNNNTTNPLQQSNSSKLKYINGALPHTKKNNHKNGKRYVNYNHNTNSSITLSALSRKKHYQQQHHYANHQQQFKTNNGNPSEGHENLLAAVSTTNGDLLVCTSGSNDTSITNTTKVCPTPALSASNEIKNHLAVTTTAVKSQARSAATQPLAVTETTNNSDSGSASSDKNGASCWAKLHPATTPKIKSSNSPAVPAADRGNTSGNNIICSSVRKKPFWKGSDSTSRAKDNNRCLAVTAAGGNKCSNETATSGGTPSKQSAMTTALAAAGTITSTATTANTSTTTSTATKQTVANVTTIPSSVVSSVAPVVASTLSVSTAVVSPSSSAAPIATTTSSSSSGPPSPNSYTLDFLHSVGVQMTGGANLAAALKGGGISNMRSSSSGSTYGNHSSGVSPARSAYSYSNALGAQRSSQRYMTGGAGGGATQHSQHGHHYQQQHHHHHHHHHHQPQQLTIASFIQKDLLGEGVLGGGGGRGNAGNSNNYEGQQQYHNQHRYHHNYYQQHYQQLPQQQTQPSLQGYSTLQHAYNTMSDNISARVVGSSGSGSPQQQRQHVFQSYHSNGGSLTSPSIAQLQHQPAHIRSQHQQNQNSSNSHSVSNTGTSAQQAKTQMKSKPNYASSSASSSCSSSSSVCSTSSQASAASCRQSQKHKPSSKGNPSIETLPASKLSSSSSQRSTHRGPHHTSTNTQTTQHQNLYNLTYVSMESAPPMQVAGVNIAGSNVSAAVATTAVTSHGCSPSPIPNSIGPLSKTESPSVLLGFNVHNLYQQGFVNSQTGSLVNVPPPPLTPTPSLTPLVQPTIVCCAQLDEPAAVSGASTGAAHPTSVSTTSTIIAGNDYDSDSSSTRSSIPTQRMYKSQTPNPVSISSSSSSSASSRSSSVHDCNASSQGLPSPIDYVGHNAGAPHYHLQQQIVHHQHVVVSPQPQAHYRNGVISLVNLPNNYSEEELATLHQHHHQQQPPHYYYTTSPSSGDHLNAVAAPGNGGYWSPIPTGLQHTNFVYASGPSNVLTTVPCSTSTSSTSPRPTEREEHLSASAQQPAYKCSLEQMSLGHVKRSSSHMTAAPSQQQRASAPISTGLTVVGGPSGGTSVTAMRTRNRNQQQTQTHHQQQLTVVPPPAQPLPHPYQSHNLLYSSNNPQTGHMRASSATTSAHDFFAHTPPDRFLARAHLIEAKEAPAALLSDSKWNNLSQGIWNKFINSQQTEETFKQKMRLWRYLYIIIKNAYPRYGLYLVGSTISGFGADTSDVDMCLVSRTTSSIDPRMEALFNLTVLRDCLSKSGEFENFNLIEAKVPILRFRDRIHQLEVDLNFNNSVGIKNTHLLYCYSQLDWRLRPLVLVTKLWAQYHNINNAKNMTISSYSLVLMVVHFLQYAVTPAVLPCLHNMFPEKFPLLRSNDFGYVDMNECIGPYESKNAQSIGELFLYFLEYYSCFDYTQFAISIRTGGLLPINVCRLAKSLKNDIHQWKELCIEEPFDLTNTARSVYDYETFERVKSVFVASWRVLQQTLDLNSIFSPISLPSPTPSSMSTTPSMTASNTSAQYPNEDGVKTTGSSATVLQPLETITNGNVCSSSPAAAISQESKSHSDKDINFNNAAASNNNNLTAIIS